MNNQELADAILALEWPLPHDVFHALVKKIVTVPIELMVRKNREVLLIYRNDAEFTGWHMPGTVIRDNESVDEAIARLVRGEVNAKVSTPRSVGWLECPRSETPSRHAIALLHICDLVGEYTGPGQFFDPFNLPADTLVHHRRMIPEILRRK